MPVVLQLCVPAVVMLPWKRTSDPPVRLTVPVPVMPPLGIVMPARAEVENQRAVGDD